MNYCMCLRVTNIERFPHFYPNTSWGWDFGRSFVNSAHVLMSVLQASELGVSQQSQSSRCRWNWPNVTGLAVWWRFHYNIYRIMQTSLCKPKNKDWGGCDTRCKTWLIIDQHQIPPYICINRSRNVSQMSRFWNSHAQGWSPSISKSSYILVKGSTGQNPKQHKQGMCFISVLLSERE